MPDLTKFNSVKSMGDEKCSRWWRQHVQRPCGRSKGDSERINSKAQKEKKRQYGWISRMNRLIWAQAFVMCVAMGSLAWLYLHFLTCKMRIKFGKLFINIAVASAASSPKYYPGHWAPAKLHSSHSPTSVQPPPSTSGRWASY